MSVKRYSVPAKKVSEVFQKTNGKCFYCGCVLPDNTSILDDSGNEIISKRNWHIDHVIPLAKGGDYSIDNLVPSCSNCNHKKGAK